MEKASEPILQIAKEKVTCYAPPQKLEQLCRQFQDEAFLVLPQFLEASLLHDIQRMIEQAEFFEKNHGRIATESCMRANQAFYLLSALANDEALFGWMQKILGCGPIGYFDGRVYRLSPEKNHYDSWHDDHNELRYAAMSINLSPQVFHGGGLQIRNVKTQKLLGEAFNTGFGDALFFRIGEGYEHQLTPLEGDISKTAFAGWFQSVPGYWSELKKEAIAGKGAPPPAF